MKFPAISCFSLQKACIFHQQFSMLHLSESIFNQANSRSLHLSKHNGAEIKIGRQLRKMLDKSSKKKKWYLAPITADGTATTYHKTITPGHRRRAEHIGKLLMQYMVSITNSGELSQELADANVELAKVRVISDFSQTLVYWHATGTAKDEEIQTIFDRSAKKLRHLITSTYVIGSVPPIQFIKDISQVKYLEIEKRLKVADFGTEFKPSSFENMPCKEILKEGEDNILTKMTDDFKKISERYIGHGLNDVINLKAACENNSDFKNSRLESSQQHDEDLIQMTSGIKLSDRYMDDGLKDVINFKAVCENDVVSGGVTSQLESLQQHNKNIIKNEKFSLPMRQDLYGLDREEMLRKLNANRNFSRRATESDLDIPATKTSSKDYAKHLKVKHKVKQKQNFYTLQEYALEIEEEK